jgi:hypothetical protein
MIRPTSRFADTGWKYKYATNPAPNKSTVAMTNNTERKVFPSFLFLSRYSGRG